MAARRSAGGLFSVAAGCLWASVVVAQEPYVDRAEAQRRAPYRSLALDSDAQPALALLRAHALREGIALEEAASAEPVVRQEGEPAELTVLTRVEHALLEARELTAQLREAAALRVLVDAERELLASLALPGSHAFLAEVYVQIGLCAALLGEDGLAETALTRALSLDPARRVEAAEAPPTTLALARRIARQHDVLPSSDNPVSIEPAGATLWLDGQRVEGTHVHARAGLHLLVAAAPGHATYASLIALEPGRRAPLRIALSQRPEQEARLALQRSHDVAEATTAARRLASVAHTPVFVLEAGHPTRALLHRCAPGGQTCQLLGLAYGATQPVRFVHSGAAQAWLDERIAPTQPRPERPVWRRWPAWVGGAALVVAGVASAFLLRPDPGRRSQRQLEIDPGVPPP